MTKKNTADLFTVLKGRAYPLAQIVTGCTNYDARQKGFRDVFDLIMSDSDHPRQQQFILALPGTLASEKHREILLDGMAKDYAGLDDWLVYVNRECAGDAYTDCRRVEPD